MNSPKKFRVWCGEEMHEPPHHFVYTLEGHIYRRYRQAAASSWDVQLIDGEVLFYTGLTDAEGREIYEGDVVEKEYEWGSELFEVVWNGSTCGFDGFSVNEDGVLNEVVGPSLKEGIVIGNRYENPELLEEETSV